MRMLFGLLKVLMVSALLCGNVLASIRIENLSDYTIDFSERHAVDDHFVKESHALPPKGTPFILNDVTGEVALLIYYLDSSPGSHTKAALCVQSDPQKSCRISVSIVEAEEKGLNVSAQGCQLCH